MHKIIDSFSIIEGENDKDILVDYLERYVLGPNGYDSKTKVFLHEINEGSSLGEDNISINKSYNRTAAGNWAYKNYNRYSKNYPKFTGKFGTDCTNFVSQAIHVGGGKPKSGKWTIRKKNSKYWVINNAKQLNYSWKLSDPSLWISVKQFRKYWKPKSTVRSFSNAYYKKNSK
ncbi:hypothetical protein HNQ35_000167 [Cerasibacillus quisquiliarum]|uniref:Putative amidase domain-containing protein n=1 Tax=Cerasibacillus quisquiliarum TaxID=227865 RepID=A0A511UU81_9BACI|nr:amidase domain-containing protein [Cerasibacillus quisquiliarum]MBB5144978.1 hypothetical protein [Cerasibacillus quisquiliarum]GEN30127.1 hypothetical protein CQU01_03650 [Cerasibacillus quisquiliarum]